jgi:hypothetical protein
MHVSDVADPAADVTDGLRELASVRLQDLLVKKKDAAPTSTLDGVIRRLFDPGDREKVTVSAFGSSL